jgi:hypothetical protein
MRTRTTVAAFVAALGLLASNVVAQTKIDLRTDEGVSKVKGQWRFANVKIVEVESKGPDGKPNKTYNIDPKAFGTDFDDSQWEVCEPTTLKNARSTGQVCFAWYRIKITLPPDADGKKVTFVTTADDYGEVWVDGKLPRRMGQAGGTVVGGFNFPNRVELSDAKAGKSYQIAVFAINGPISAAPGNFIFLRDTFLEIADKP